MDAVLQGSYALDLKPLIRDKDLTVSGYVTSLVEGMKSEIQSNLANFEDD